MIIKIKYLFLILCGVFLAACTLPENETAIENRENQEIALKFDGTELQFTLSADWRQKNLTENHSPRIIFSAENEGQFLLILKSKNVLESTEQAKIEKKVAEMFSDIEEKVFYFREIIKDSTKAELNFDAKISITSPLITVFQKIFMTPQSIFTVSCSAEFGLVSDCSEIISSFALTSSSKK